MVNYCRVIGCTNRSDRETNLHFYRLPKVLTNQGADCEKLCDERRRLWIASLQQDFSGKNLDNVRICSAHFLSGKKSELYDKTSPDWVPSVNMLPVEMKYQNSEKAPSSRYERQKYRSEKKKMTDAATSLLELSEGVECYSLNIEHVESGTESCSPGKTIFPLVHS